MNTIRKLKNVLRYQLQPAIVVNGVERRVDSGKINSDSRTDDMTNATSNRTRTLHRDTTEFMPTVTCVVVTLRFQVVGDTGLMYEPTSGSLFRLVFPALSAIRSHCFLSNSFSGSVAWRRSNAIHFCYQIKVNRKMAAHRWFDDGIISFENISIKMILKEFNLAHCAKETQKIRNYQIRNIFPN